MMMMRIYVLIFLIISTALGYEWLILNERIEGTDLFSYFPSLKDVNRSTLPGRPISLWLGYIGIGLMCIMNIYTIRKKFSFMKEFGSKEHFLDFHIFCGLVGPVFIIFHTNFVIGGLVAISFWSMVVSASSGVVGKFFYSQILQKRSTLTRRTEKIDEKLNKMYQKVNKKLEAKGKDSIDHSELKEKFLTSVGVKYEEHERHDASVFGSLVNSILIPLKYSAAKGSLRNGCINELEYNYLKEFAFTHRKIFLLNANKKIMGHWNTFHKPFAMFMYSVAAIHIISALTFQVKH
jgi:hypothetical protein